MLAVGTPQSGEYNDLYAIDSVFKEMLEILEQADINHRDTFLNVDPGFDSKEMRRLCDKNEIELNVKPNKRNAKQDNIEYKYFDDELYKRRTKVEHANAWPDAFKALLVRYEKKIFTWDGAALARFYHTVLTKIISLNDFI